MGFAAPFWLLLAASGLGVLYLHIRRRKTIAVSSLMLWQRVASGRVTRRPMKMPPWSLALALQLAVVALLTLALAEPLLSGKDAAPRVFVVDATALPASVEAAKRELAALPPGPQNPVSVIAAGPVPRIIVASGTNANAMDTALVSIARQDGAIDGARTAELIEKVGTPESVAAWVMGTGAPSVQATIARNENTWAVTGSVTVPQGADVPASLKVLFKHEGTPGFLDWADQPLAFADDTAPLAFNLDLPGPGIVSFQAGTAGQRFALNAEPRETRVLYLGEPTAALVRALQAVPGTKLFQADTLPTSDSDFDLVVVDDTTVSRIPATNVLWVGAAHLEGAAAPQPIQSEAATLWSSDHPLSQNVDWTSLHTIVGHTVASKPGAVTLLGVGGQPLVTARTTRFGRDVHMGLDLDATPWADDPSYLNLVVNVLRWSGLAETATAQACVTGQPCALPARLLAGTISQVPEAVVARGEHFETPILPATAFTGDEGWVADGLDSFIPKAAGLYRLTGTDGKQALVAVNAAIGNADAAGTDDAVPPPAGAIPTIWWLLAGLSLVLIAGEIALAVRRGERLNAPRGDNSFFQNRLMQVSLGLTGLFLVMALANVPVPQLSAGQRVVIAATDKTVAELAIPGAVALSMGDEARPGGAAGDALAFAAAHIPEGQHGRVLLDWNGFETRAGLNEALATLANRAIPTDVLLPPAATDTIVESITAPARVFAGDAFTLNAMIVATEPQDTQELEILRDGEVIATQDVTLAAGSNRIEALARAETEGPALYEIALANATPGSRAGIWVDAAKAPRLALLASNVADADPFAEALRLQGLDVTALPANRAPSGLPAWLAYDAFALLDVPAIGLGTRQQEQLETAVRDHGRGLLILGGPNSFGPGGYFETPLEALSPLSSRVPRNAPKTGFVFVLDRSGSMQRDEGGADRLTIAKAATLNASGLLNPQSQVGIVAFDSAAHVVLPLQEAGNEAGIRAALGQLDADGGTSVYPALVEAIAMLRTVDLPKRHIVVISDGLTQPGEFATLLAEAREANITVSTIAVGDSADPTSLSNIAELGGGAFHWSRDFRALPGILAQEALLSSTSPIQERTVAPQWVNRTAAFLKAAPESVPAIAGYVDTTAKPRAHLHLATSDADGNVVPLMASWRYGAGQVLSLATQATGRWTAGWGELSDYPRFWAQIARGLTSAPSGLTIDVTLKGDDATASIAGTAPTATVAGPEGEALPLQLIETTPGQWLGRFPALADGNYTIAAADGESSATARLHVAYPAALSLLGADADKAASVARITGGKVLTNAGEFADAPASWVLVSGWRLWLIAAMALFLATLALRYLPGLLPTRINQSTSAPPLKRAA